jgi:hypothetical protein
VLSETNPSRGTADCPSRVSPGVTVQSPLKPVGIFRAVLGSVQVEGILSGDPCRVPGTEGGQRRIPIRSTTSASMRVEQSTGGM